MWLIMQDLVKLEVSDNQLSNNLNREAVFLVQHPPLRHLVSSKDRDVGILVPADYGRGLTE